MSSLVNPIETITKFNGVNYPPSQLFLETENYVSSRDPTLDRNSPEFSKMCVRHVTQRLDLSVPAISDLLKGVKENQGSAWSDFKTDFALRFARPSDHVGLQLSDIFKLRPDSLSTGDLTSFCSKVRNAVSDYLAALEKIPRFQPISDGLKNAHNLFTAHIAESVLYSTLPRKLVESISHNYVPPDNERLIPANFARACERVPQVFESPGAVVAHMKRVSCP